VNPVCQQGLARSVVEVRVATDDWEEPAHLHFDFILHGLPSPIPREWDEGITALQAKINKLPDWPDADIRLTTYDELSSAEYLASYQFDWDGIS
jgi:hypothetical protein